MMPQHGPEREPHVGGDSKEEGEEHNYQASSKLYNGSQHFNIYGDDEEGYTTRQQTWVGDAFV